MLLQIFLSIHKDITKLCVCTLDFRIPNKIEINSFHASMMSMLLWAYPFPVMDVHL